MVRTEKIVFQVGEFELKRLSIEIAAGEYFVLLGPPGSGKTVFLECLCGLKRLNSGRIYIDGRDVIVLEPRLRKIGYVPQDYALFPHLSVEQNISFGLRVRGLARHLRWKFVKSLLMRSVFNHDSDSVHKKTSYRFFFYLLRR